MFGWTCNRQAKSLLGHYRTKRRQGHRPCLQSRHISHTGDTAAECDKVWTVAVLLLVEFLVVVAVSLTVQYADPRRPSRRTAMQTNCDVYGCHHLRRPHSRAWSIGVGTLRCRFRIFNIQCGGGQADAEIYSNSYYKGTPTNEQTDNGRRGMGR